MNQLDSHLKPYNSIRRIKSVLKFQNSSRSGELSSQKILQLAGVQSVVQPKHNRVNCQNSTTYERLQTFQVKPIFGLNLISGLPLQKYDKVIIRDQYLQKNLIEKEMLIILDKINTLKQKILDTDLVVIFPLLLFQNQKKLNLKLEECIGLTMAISQKLLFGKCYIEFSDNPSRLELESFPDLSQKRINDEITAFNTNLSYFGQSSDLINKANTAFNIIMRQDPDKIFSCVDFNMLFQHFARLRLVINSIVEEIQYHLIFQLERYAKAKEIQRFAQRDPQKANSVSPRTRKMFQEINQSINILKNVNHKHTKSDVSLSKGILREQMFSQKFELLNPKTRRQEKTYRNFSNLKQALLDNQKPLPSPSKRLVADRKLQSLQKVIDMAIKSSEEGKIVYSLKKYKL